LTGYGGCSYLGAAIDVADHFLVKAVFPQAGSMNPEESRARRAISIWFIVGISLLVNGLIIFAAGIYELIQPPPAEIRVVMFQYHASLWWGALLVILGALYCWYFVPRQNRAD
jgi:hypothetical protein